MQAMRTRTRLAVLGLAALVGGALLGQTVAVEAGQPAPLPVQIPIRDLSEPPTPPLDARPFVPLPTRQRKVRKARPAKRRHVARPRPPRKPKAPRPPAPAAGPKLEQRPEVPTESIMSLDALPPAKPAPGPAHDKTPGSQAAPAPKPAPAPAAPPAPAPAEFPPKPAAGPPPAPAKP